MRGVSRCLNQPDRQRRETAAENMQEVRVGTDLVLRRAAPADAPGLFAVHSDPRVYELDPDERHVDIEYTERWLAPILEHWDRQGFGYWTVLVPTAWWPAGKPDPFGTDSDRVIAGMGGVRLHEALDRPALNVYYRFAPAVQGRGLAGAVVQAAVEWAEQAMPGTDLVVRTRSANAAARRVAERAGFVDEGTDPTDDGLVLLRLRPVGDTR